MVLKLKLAHHKAEYGTNCSVYCHETFIQLGVPSTTVTLTPKEVRQIATKMLQMADHIEKPVEHYSRVIKVRS